jgi:hypothetical protein
MGRSYRELWLGITNCVLLSLLRFAGVQMMWMVTFVLD